MKKTNPYLSMDKNTLAATAILQAMELQLKAAKVLLICPPYRDVVKSVLDTLDNSKVAKRLLGPTDIAEAFAAPPPELAKPVRSTKGMGNFSEVPETTAAIVIGMSGTRWQSIPKIAAEADVSVETVRRYLYKVLLPNQMAAIGTGDDGRPAYRKILRNTRKIE